MIHTIYAYLLSLPRLVSNKVLETKRRGSKTSAAYLADWAFAMPFYQDKQLSQPTPSRIIYRYANKPVVACTHTGIIHPAWTLRCGIFLS